MEKKVRGKRNCEIVKRGAERNIEEGGEKERQLVALRVERRTERYRKTERPKIEKKNIIRERKRKKL
jgi:hypothetical protein